MGGYATHYQDNYADPAKVLVDPFSRKSMMIELVGGERSGDKVTLPWPAPSPFKVPLHEIKPWWYANSEAPSEPLKIEIDEYVLRRVVFKTDDGYVVRWVYYLEA